jgi:hypothetical protein
VKSGPSRIRSSTYAESSVMEASSLPLLHDPKLHIVTALGLSANGGKAIRNSNARHRQGSFQDRTERYELP